MKISNRENKNYSFDFFYFNTPRVNISCESDTKVNVEFYEDNGDLIYRAVLTNNMFASISREYHSNFYIKIYDEFNEDLVRPDFTGKRVYIHLDSSSLGDTIAWFPQVAEFGKEHACHLICSTFNNKFFAGRYPEVEFVEPGTTVPDLYKMFTIGWFYKENGEIDYNKNPLDFRDQHLQKTASDILGLKFSEIRPKLDFEAQPRPVSKKYFCIANHSTAQAKYWNNPDGWQDVVDYLVSENYEVIILSREDDGYMGNPDPKGGIKLQNKTLLEISNYIYHAEGFIGLGSGLSWLAWALNKKVILISGFSKPVCEMTECIRIFVPENENFCSGCFNEFKFDQGDWNWCPRHKGTDRQFECTKSISSERVINGIRKISLPAKNSGVQA